METATKDSVKVVWCFFGLLCFTGLVEAQGAGTIRSAYDLYDFLFSNYTADIRPVNNENDITYISTSASLIMIQELNEVNSQLTTTMSFFMGWTDPQLTWNPADYEGRVKMMVEAKKIWTPKLTMVSPSQRTDRLGTADGTMATVYASGFVYVNVLDIFYTVCSVDITYYPFDWQGCEIRMSNYEYLGVFRYVLNNSTIDTHFYAQNGLWSLENTQFMSKSDNGGITYDIIARILLKRRATYPVLNTLVPVIILILLNGTVFLLPSDSGERLGFAVTILLSIAVYMTIISDELPKTSQPTAILVYVLVTYLAQSAILCIATIYSLRLYVRETKPIPKAWCAFVRVVKCRSCRGKMHPQVDKKHEAENLDNVDDLKENGQIQTPSKPFTLSDITWKTVSEAYDTFILIINTMIAIIVIIAYLSLVLPNAKENVQPFLDQPN